jgi:hypothetical protein
MLGTKKMSLFENGLNMMADAFNAKRVRHASFGAIFGGLLLAFQPAQADFFDVVLGDGFSKDNPDLPVSTSSRFGASLAGTHITFNSSTGVLRANVFNSGEGTLTGLGLALSTAFTGLTADFTFLPGSPCDGCGFVDSSPAANNIAGPFDNAEPGGFDAGAENSGNVHTGLASGERATFIWDFDTTFDTIESFFGDGGDTSVVTLLEVPDTGALTTDGSNVSAFWVAHVQQLEGGESDRIGGQGTVISEPGTIALFGFGLAGLGFYRRRRAARTNR